VIFLLPIAITASTPPPPHPGCGYIIMTNKNSTFFFVVFVWDVEVWGGGGGGGGGVLAVIAIGNKNITSEIGRQLDKLGIENVVFNPGWHTVSIDELDFVFNCLSDSRSKYVFYCYFRGRCEDDPSYYKRTYEECEYFCIDPFHFEDNRDLLFLDLGAYDGDTLEQFVEMTKGVFNQIISFEPAPKTFEILVEKAAKLKKTYNLADEQIECVCEGVGEKNENKDFFIFNEYLPYERWLEKPNASGNTSERLYSTQYETFETVNTEITSVDNYFKGRSDKKITMIKADIEGAELSMLKGAYKIIKRHLPVLAICIYHKTNDICEIPLFIKANFPEYNMFIRHHHLDHAELVLYCCAQ
jgi:FkbM family methyltransferase